MMPTAAASGAVQEPGPSTTGILSPAVNGQVHLAMASPEDLSPEGEKHRRTAMYWEAANKKRKASIGFMDQGSYYATLIRASRERSDPAAVEDRRQIGKDLPRTFESIAPGQAKDTEPLLPSLFRILTAYVERGRALSATNYVHTVGGIKYDAKNSTPTHLHSRGLLTGYAQGLNFLAGMSLLCAGATSPGKSRALFGEDVCLEQTAFWLLALLLEDVLDPDFFGADVRDNLQMAYIGGLAMRDLVLHHAEAACPVLFNALGREAFQNTMSVVLDQWVLSLFIGCAPRRLLEDLWDHLLLPRPEDVLGLENQACPRGLAYFIAFTLATLRCCGDEQLRGTEVLERLQRLRQGGAPLEDVSLEAGEAVKRMRTSLLHWPAAQDAHLLSCTEEILEKFMWGRGAADVLWVDVREQKQRIVGCVGNIDEQLVALARRTHFSQEEIQRLRAEFEQMPEAKDGKITLLTFEEIVSRSVPEFPLDLCGRLFDKLDAFCVGRLSFVELVCGMSALSLGTMDEKLKVCFDLFDSEGHRALTLKDLGDLCTVLFRVALAQGFSGANKASTADVVHFLEKTLLDGRQVSNGSTDSTETSLIDKTRPLLQYDLRARTFSAGDDKPKSSTSIGSSSSPTASARAQIPVWCRQDVEVPWRSMLLRLLAAAQVHTPGGPLLIGFEDFLEAAHREPALLCLFSWCLPRPPACFHAPVLLSPELQDVPRGVCSYLLLQRFWQRIRRDMLGRDDGTEQASLLQYRRPM